MLQFILTNVLLVAVGVILYLVVRALPRLDEAELVRQAGVLERLVTSDIPEKMDVFLNSFFLKFLRRAKVAILRVDNFLTGHLKRIKAHTENGKSAIDFKDMVEKKTKTKAVAKEEKEDNN